MSTSCPSTTNVSPAAILPAPRDAGIQARHFSPGVICSNISRMPGNSFAVSTNAGPSVRV
jgi:hypothetical protein